MWTSDGGGAEREVAVKTSPKARNEETNRSFLRFPEKPLIPSHFSVSTAFSLRTIYLLYLITLTAMFIRFKSWMFSSVNVSHSFERVTPAGC